MIQIPETFERSLRNYDPQLRLRYGSYVKEWIIERIGRVSEAEARLLHYGATRPDADPKAREEWESARNGRHVIHYAKYLDQRVHDYLWKHDLQKQGFKVLSRFMAGKARERKAAAARGHEVTKEVAEVMHFMLNHKSSDIDAGKSDKLMREAFHLPARPEPKKSAEWDPKRPPSPLVDQFGRDLKPRNQERKVMVL
jgi:hypothetical protein